jgi:hypothetical protein
MTDSHPQNPPEPHDSSGSKHFDVFISYASEDSEFVRSIRTRLANRNLTCWFDQEQLKPGQDWSKALKDAISDSRLCLIVIGRHVQDKPWLSKEWALILASTWDQSDLAVLPVLVDNADLPTFLRKWQYFRCERTSVDVDDVCNRVEQTFERKASQKTYLAAGEPEKTKAIERFEDILRLLEADKGKRRKQRGSSDE